MMWRLYHFPLCPRSRKVRLILAEKGLPYEAVEEDWWKRRPAFLEMNPAGEVPVLEEDGARILAGHRVIEVHLEETHPLPPLLPATPDARAEARRLLAWFDDKFDRDVTVNLVHEKIVRRRMNAAGAHVPDMTRVRRGLANLRLHLDYIGALARDRNWLAGRTMTLADLAAAGHVSALDYLGDVPWPQYPAAKDWYARIKSRPSFRTLLADRLPGLPPPRAYGHLDF